MLDRRDPADHLVDRDRNQIRIRPQLLHFVGVLNQCEQAPRQGSTGGVVARACQRDKVGRCLKFTDQAAVDLGRRNQRRHVIGGATAPLPCDSAEEIHVGHGRTDQIAAALHLRVAASEIGPCDIEKMLAVLVRDTEDQHNDLQRVPNHDIVIEIASATMREHAVDAFMGQPADALLEQAYLFWLKPRVGKLLVFGVVGIIHLIDGADEHGPSAHGFLHLRFEFDREKLGARRVDELVVLLLDLHHILVLRNGPERPVTVRLGPMHRIFAAHHRKQRMLLLEVTVGLVAGDRFIDAGILHHVSP